VSLRHFRCPPYACLQNPLTHRHIGKHVFCEVRCAIAHAPRLGALRAFPRRCGNRQNEQRLADIEGALLDREWWCRAYLDVSIGFLF